MPPAIITYEIITYIIRVSVIFIDYISYLSHRIINSIPRADIEIENYKMKPVFFRTKAGVNKTGFNFI